MIFFVNQLSDFMNYTNSNRIFFSEEVIFNIREIEAIIMIIMNMNRTIIEEEDWDGQDMDKWYKLMDIMTKKKFQSLEKGLRKNLEIC